MGGDIKKTESDCGICGKPIGHVLEMPGQVCFGCTGKVTDENGRRLAFWSMLLRHGHRVTYLDTDEPREGDVCFINGMRCRAFVSITGGFCFQVHVEPSGE